MPNFKIFQDQLSHLDESEFELFALELFHFQAENNPVYSSYIQFIGKNHAKINALDEIPFLPISFFKSQRIKTGVWSEKIVFESSGTTSNTTSQHLIPDLLYYHKHAERLFEQSFGPLEDYVTLALLPSYLERKNSSLVSMVDYFISRSQQGSGFYLHNIAELKEAITEHKDKKIVLWGVTFALLELAREKIDLEGVRVIETGGMKGRGPELTREELYNVLRLSFGVADIYSEYGMTELLSQSYGCNGQFKNSFSQRVLIRQTNDPFSYVAEGRSGGMNIVDLANIHSCAFIETQDLGKYTSENTYEVLGRFDNSDLRGCNLLLNV